MARYNGHLNWNYWNVSLWINNDEGLYRLALECIRRSITLTGAAKLFINSAPTWKTPDGAEYTVPSVRAALKDM